MTRSSLLCGFLGLLSVGVIGALPLACGGGGVGDPCIPEDEYDPQFSGFTLTLENIESRSFQCQTRICLVNHFQGRVSCPLGQPPAKICTQRDETSRVVSGDKSKCADDEDCVETQAIAEDCDPTSKTNTCPFGSACDKDGKFCRCTDDVTAPADAYKCDKGGQFKAFLCHKKNNCQQVGAATKDNCNSNGTPKDCCIPGQDKPIAAEVCGQCDDKSERSADQAVYCSCRCDVAEGQQKDPNFNFCSCPTGFECSQIRPDEGLGDVQLAGKYCIKSGTDYGDGTAAQQNCNIAGHSGGTAMGVQCNGTPTNECNGS